MSYPNSVEEINQGLIAEGLDALLNSDSAEKVAYETERDIKNGLKPIFDKQNRGYGYWLDNCGDDAWYCEHCLQEDCGKRMAKLK